MNHCAIVGISVRILCTIGACCCALAFAACSSDKSGSPDGGTSPDSSTAMDSGASPDAGAGGGTDGAVADGASGSQPDGGAEGGPSNDAGEGGIASTATIFLSSGNENVVYRFSVTANGDPQLSTKISVPSPAGLTVGPTGELFVGDYADSKIYRFVSPLGSPAPNGTIATGLSSPEEMRFVDNQLWVVNSDSAGSANPVNVVQFGFDTGGNASVAGTVTSGLIGANRGMLWNAPTRDLYVSQCCSTSAIQHFRVATSDTATALAAITGQGLASPHGMVVTPWGELIVANPGTTGGGTTLLRFSIDAQGNATANGTIAGNGILFPIGLALAPWGELFVANNRGVLSRFTFDSSHAAVPSGTFATPAPYLNWLAIVPGGPTSTGGDGGAIDAGSSAGSLDGAGASDAAHD